MRERLLEKLKWLLIHLLTSIRVSVEYAPKSRKRRRRKIGPKKTI
jgi:hypothetical protein